MQANSNCTTFRPLRCALLTRSLDVGGAERQLTELATGLAARGHTVVVFVFYATGPFVDVLRKRGIDVRSLNKRGRWEMTRFLFRTHRAFSEFRPDVVYSFLSVPNIVSAVVGRLLGVPVVWGVRNTADPSDYPEALTRLSLRVERRLSSMPHLIVCNSAGASSFLISRRVEPQRLRVVHNCVDADQFIQDEPGAKRLRALWNVGDRRAVGIVGRLDLRKDHVTFLRAARLVVDVMPGVLFVAVGDGPSALAQELKAEASRLELDEHLVWAGAHSDMPAVYSAFDLLVSSSCSEGFQNVILEALSCGTPAVATAVGASAEILDEDSIVPPRDPEALAGKIVAMLRTRIDRKKTRALVLQKFGRDAMAEKTERLMWEVTKGV